MTTRFDHIQFNHISGLEWNTDPVHFTDPTDSESEFKYLRYDEENNQLIWNDIVLGHWREGYDNNRTLWNPINEGPVVISPHGSDRSFSLSETDTSNQRGQYAVDLSLSRSENYQVASGEASTISGGTNNTASSLNSTVSGGSNHYINGQHSTVSGGINNSIGRIENPLFDPISEIPQYLYREINQSSIGGGYNNVNYSSGSTISGGVNNVTGAIYNPDYDPDEPLSADNYRYKIEETSSINTIGGGRDNQCTGEGSSIGGGGDNIATGDYSGIGGGLYNLVTEDYSFAIGYANEPGTINNQERIFMIGNGIDPNDRSNLFSITTDGQVHITGQLNTEGADVAEYYETRGEVLPIGTSVAFDGGYIRKATSSDRVLGVVSDTAGLVMNAYSESWHGKYIKEIEEYDDVEIIYEDYQVTREEYIRKNGKWYRQTITNTVKRPVTEVVDVYDENDNVVCTKIVPKTKLIGRKTRIVNKINPDYDPNIEYIPRHDRKEWHIIGLLGKCKVLKEQHIDNRWILVSDDGDYYTMIIR